ncbi:MAG: hypothetical protein JKX99_00055 [Robiginitomaculum sp.]|nr:hypothetical protein [Robiginitomaculum sp.]
MNTGPLIALGLVFLLLLGGALRAAFGYWMVRRDANDEWQAFAKTNSKEARRTNQQQFVQAYTRAHNPRGLAYGTAALALAALVTPLAVMALTFIYANVIVQTPDEAAPIATTLAQEVRQQLRRDGPLVYSFFLFFGLIGSWGGVAYVVARLYHRDGVSSLGDELRTVRGDAPLPMGKPARKRPKWSPLVRSGEDLVLGEEYGKPTPTKED